MTTDTDTKLATIALHGIGLWVGEAGLRTIRAQDMLTEGVFRDNTPFLSIRLAMRRPEYNDKVLTWVDRHFSENSSWEWRVAGWYACEELPLYYMSQDMLDRLTDAQLCVLSTVNHK